jgi:hypothetical protein
VKVISADELVTRLAAFGPANTRVVASGNAAVPWQLLEAANASLDSFRLFMINAPVGVPTR